ncbi:MAG: 3-isopropylmalate dehydratase small subunit [Candidatus Hecatellales archaeon]|nr:MAG: 3-isopropylmalate dehydratase small subunit [Candidatus Hecatellales archaeon]
MKVKGKTWKFGDDINTDIIISGKYKFKTLDMKELAKHAMEALDPNFSKKVKPGDLMVAGKNFGCGSSREHAPRVLKELGIGAVIAKSFARIFYRNAVNVGLPVVEAPEAAERIAEGSMVEVDLEKGVIRDLTEGKTYSFKPIPSALMEILREGGLVEYLRKAGDYKL